MRLLEDVGWCLLAQHQIIYVHGACITRGDEDGRPERTPQHRGEVLVAAGLEDGHGAVRVYIVHADGAVGGAGQEQAFDKGRAGSAGHGA